MSSLRAVQLDSLIIEDESALARLPIYAQLKQVVVQERHQFFVPVARAPVSWDRAAFLNLTFWGGADVLCDDHVAADVVAHIAWHRLATRAVGQGKAAVSALFLGESIASAFDLYLVGRLLAEAPESNFIETQVPLMTEAAEQAGLSEKQVAGILEGIVADPEQAFEDLRALLFDVTHALFQCSDVQAGASALDAVASHRFAPLLHHYQLSNWVLFARAHGQVGGPIDDRARAVDAQLRAADGSLLWLIDQWIEGNR